METQRNCITKINDILKHTFHIHNSDMFRSLLMTHTAVIAGGLPSFAYSNPANNATVYKGDIDIWIPLVGLTPELKSQNAKQISREFIQLNNLSEYSIMVEFDFSTRWTHYDANKNSYMDIHASNLSDICYMTKLCNNKTQKEIQLIFTNVSTDDAISHFDISSCMVSWNGYSIYCFEPNLTQLKIGYVVNKHKDTNTRRIKYSKRGYNIFDTKADAYDYYSSLFPSRAPALISDHTSFAITSFAIMLSSA